MNTKIYDDPSHYSGIWFTLHTYSIVCNTYALKQSFVILINALLNNFKCLECKSHFKQFIDTHPISHYFNMTDTHGRDSGLFKWTWECHNEVNKRLHQYQPSFEEAYAVYSGDDNQTIKPLTTLPARTLPIRRVPVRTVPVRTVGTVLRPQATAKGGSSIPRPLKSGCSTCNRKLNK